MWDTSLATVRTFFNQVWHKMFGMLLCYTVTSAQEIRLGSSSHVRGDKTSTNIADVWADHH